jgi:hypothetical protein
MATINIKIVGVEGNSVLVKYATDNSLKSIDDYDAIAYQPAGSGYNDVENFIEGIKMGLMFTAMSRDKLEQAANNPVDYASWVGVEQSITISDALLDTSTVSPEVVL